MTTFESSFGLLGEEAEQNRRTGTEGEQDDEVNEIRFPLTRLEVGAVFCVFIAFAAALSVVYMTMPTVDYQVLKLPHNVDEVRLLTEYISGYAKDYPLQVTLGYIFSYVFMQTFMIPGTIFMSLLAGSLFGVTKGLFLVVVTATTGASSCYFLSKLVGRPLAYWLWPEKLRFFSSEIARRKKSLLNYMLFLRITPTLPNTFINVASPIVGVPYRTFVLATFFGLIPAALVTVKAGLALNDLKSVRDLYDAKTLGALFFIGLVSVVPTWAEKVRTQVGKRPPRAHAE
ncbi:hypothetical protein R1flu_021539 [Riccia fluitans]|uniref:VTT domain-containing protein n=1 Tax=Riccia fluitans TaxID=41844 RepID=A0ABD1ZRE8_9MARC